MHARDASAEQVDPPTRDLDACASKVIRAQDGDAESLTWLVVHLSPLLRAQAQYRLRGSLEHACDPDDLVHETWAVALSKLGDLRGEPRALGRVLLKFLSSTLLHKAQGLLQRQHWPITRALPNAPESSDAPLDRITGKCGPSSGLLDGLEVQAALHDAIDSLSEGDREVVVLRGLEQRSNEEVASLLGVTPAGATRRYQRALQRLRHRLPGSAFDWLLRE